MPHWGVYNEGGVYREDTDIDFMSYLAPDFGVVGVLFLYHWRRALGTHRICIVVGCILV